MTPQAGLLNPAAGKVIGSVPGAVKGNKCQLRAIAPSAEFLPRDCPPAGARVPADNLPRAIRPVIAARVFLTNARRSMDDLSQILKRRDQPTYSKWPTMSFTTDCFLTI